MIIALDENNNRIGIETVIHQDYKNMKFYCPCCGSELFVRNGNINTPHFAHKTIDICDDFSRDMSEWHFNWQKLFPVDNREVIIEMDISLEDYIERADEWNFYRKKKVEKMGKLADENGMLKIKHRADVCVGKYVIEFQHSPIPCKEFNERNWFYTSSGYKVIWIFDVEGKVENDRIYEYDSDDEENDKDKYVWKYPARCFKNHLPQWEDEVILFLQFVEPYNDYTEDESGYLYKVFWCIDDENDKGESYASYRRFMAECDDVGNFIELQEAITENRL